MDVSEFLLARIGEDEAEAQSALKQPYGDAESGPYAWCFDRDYGPTGMLDVSPGRVLVECEAKRRIVALFDDADENGFDTAMDACLALAAVYADHPDYQPGWKPKP